MPCPCFSMYLQYRLIASLWIYHLTDQGCGGKLTPHDPIATRDGACAAPDLTKTLHNATNYILPNNIPHYHTRITHAVLVMNVENHSVVQLLVFSVRPRKKSDPLELKKAAAALPIRYGLSTWIWWNTSTLYKYDYDMQTTHKQWKTNKPAITWMWPSFTNLRNIKQRVILGGRIPLARRHHINKAPSTV